MHQLYLVEEPEKVKGHCSGRQVTAGCGLVSQGVQLVKRNWKKITFMSYILRDVGCYQLLSGVSILRYFRRNLIRNKLETFEDAL